MGELRPGTHLCALYSGPSERDRILLSFLEEGLRDGDKCLCLMDDGDAASVRERAVGPPTAGHRRSDQFDMDLAADAYLRAGRFSAEQMIAFLARCVYQAAQGEFPLLRAAGEMSWVLPQPVGANDFFVYESAINRAVDHMPAVFMCMYDLQRFGVSMLVDVLQTHTKVLLDRTVLDNPRYLPPAEHPTEATARSTTARRPAPKRGMPASSLLIDRWAALTEAELRVADHVASGMTNRAIAEKLSLSHHTIDAHLKHTYNKLGIHSRVELTVLTLEHRPSHP